MFTGSQRVSSYRSNPSKRSMAAFSTKRSSITPSVSRTSLKPSMPVPSRRFRGLPSSILSCFVSIPCRSEGSSEDGRCGGAARPTGAEPYTCIRDTFHIKKVRMGRAGFPFIWICRIVRFSSTVRDWPVRDGPFIQDQLNYFRYLLGCRYRMSKNVI